MLPHLVGKTPDKIRERARRGAATCYRVLLLAGLAAGLRADFLPLQPGNQWVYRSSGRICCDTMTLEVARTETFDGHVYSLVKGFRSGDAWLRVTENDDLVEWDPTQKAEKTWVKFRAAERQPYETAMDTCTASASVASRAANLDGPLGKFDWALAIDYKPKCADAGLEQEYYLPDVGLVRRVEQSIAGPVTWDLVYARVGGFSVFSAPEVAFGLSLDRAVYAPGANLTARITLRNSQSEPLRMVFSSGQTYDLVIRDGKGQEVWKWSTGRVFTMALRTVDFDRGETNWPVVAPLTGLPAGEYIAEAWLVMVGQKTWAASAPFRIAAP